MNMQRIIVSTSLFVFLTGLLLIPIPVRAGGSETVLPESGIRYPGGFDSNTVGDVTGKVSGLILPEQGPVRFRIDTGSEHYTVLASASWYWKDLGVDLKEGMEVRVRGSKTLGKDTNLYVVAQKISITGSSGKSYAMRNSAGTPMWSGGNGMAGGMGGGMGSQRGSGMMGGGMGGMGMGGGMGGMGMGGGMRR